MVVLNRGGWGGWSKLGDSVKWAIGSERNREVIKVGEQMRGIGPEGGAGGGEIIVAGTRHEGGQCEGSYTGQFLKKLGL